MSEDANQRNERVARERRAYVGDLRKMLQETGGRRVLWRLLESTGVFHSGYVADSDATVFNAGKREVGLALLLDIEEADIDALARMTLENKSHG